jgi:hypothetical protein
VKKNIKDQILFDSFKEIFDEVQEAQELATKACFRIWNSSDELLEDFGMETMDKLDEVGLSELRLKEVVEDRDLANKKSSRSRR